MNNRLTILRSFLKKHSLDCVLITSPSNIAYVSGFVSFLSTEREAYVLVSAKNAYIFTSRLYASEVKRLKTCELVELTSNYSLRKALADIVAKENIASIGFEKDNLTFDEHEQLTKQLPLSPTSLSGIRAEKDADEIARIEKACSIGDEAFTYILSQIKEGISEQMLAYRLETFIREKGAQLSFPSIIAFGKNAAVPHHVTGKDTLQKNQFVLLDFGVRHENYCSDMTRTVFFGKPTEKERHAYETVEVAQEKAIEYLKSKILSVKDKEESAGVTREEGIPTTRTEQSEGALVGGKRTAGPQAFEVDKISRDYIISQGFPSFPHSLGHGIGIDVHEPPSLSPFNKEHLEPGMVFSIEPGIYIDNDFGIRIEDLVALTELGLFELTRSSKKLITV